MIRAGLTPDVADDILVKRFSGNPRLWGAVLTVLGIGFLLQRVFDVNMLMRGIMPLLLIALGIYVLRGYIFKPKAADRPWSGTDASASFALTQSRYNDSDFRVREDYGDRTRTGNWRDI